MSRHADLQSGGSYGRESGETVDAAARLAFATARLDDGRVRTILGAASLIVAYWLVVLAKADNLVTLESLRWKHRVILLDTKETPSDRADWAKHSTALSERNLVLFRKGEHGYLQQFPKPPTRVSLRLAPEIERRARGRVTLIGKDGRVKGQWTSETANLPAVVFQLVDRMPMRQREAEENEAAGRVFSAPRQRSGSPAQSGRTRGRLRLDDLRGRVLVVRFWTDTCPYCDASLPAMQKLAEEMKDAPVTSSGLYQSKPLGSERTWKGVVAHAAELGVTFPIAYDHELGNAPIVVARRHPSASDLRELRHRRGGQVRSCAPRARLLPERGPRRRPRQRRFRSHSRRDRRHLPTADR